MMFNKILSIFDKKVKSETNLDISQSIENKSCLLKKTEPKRPLQIKKKKRLPDNFQKLLEEEDIVSLKEVFVTCDINARAIYFKNTALMGIPMSDAFFAWLIEQGADISAVNTDGQTVLHIRAGSYQSLDGLFDLGLNINQQDKNGNTPLHEAARSLKDDNVYLLIKHGADVHIENQDGQTALERALIYCSNYDLEGALINIVTHLITAGAIITPKMRERVKGIGENFEFHRLGYNAETVDIASSGLDKLYKIFNIGPVSRRIVHDGQSSIIVQATQWDQQFEELWQFLIPSSGPALTVQGEVIRIAGRINHELDGNGGINWDTNFKKMADCFYEYVKSGHPLDENHLNETKSLINDIKKKYGDTDRLRQLSVLWVLQNPKPIKLSKPLYNR